MSRSWSWREADPDDAAAQCRLFNLCFGKDKGVETFRWRYWNNPHGRALSRVALDGGGRIVGGYSYVPRRFRRDGRPVLLMQASDAMVDPSARRQGIFTGLDDIVAEAAGALGVDHAFAYSGRLSLHGFLGNGWRLIGHAPVYRYAFRSRRGLERSGRIAPLAVKAAPLVDALWARRDRRLDALAPSARRLVPIERFDERADELFEACVPREGLLGERDADWLNWRYVDTPSRRQVAWALAGEADRWDGWLVAEFVGGHGYLIDHLARDGEARQTLLEAFTHAAHARGVEEATALLFEHHPSVSVLESLGWRRPLRRKPFRDMFPFIVRACRPEAVAADERMTRWLLADGDRDAEHMSP